MYIAMSSGIFPPDIGGPANFVPRIAGWLAGRAHTVSVVCWSDRLDHDDSGYPFAVHRIARGRTRGARAAATIAALRANAGDADIIFANTLDMEAHVAARLAGHPIVHKVVGDRAWEIARSRGWFVGDTNAYQTAAKSPALRLLDRLRDYPLRRADAVIVPSRYLAGIVAGWGVPAGRIRVVPNATPLDAPAGRIDLAPFAGRTLATVCRLVPWKGVDRLVAVIAAMPEVRLVIAGDGPERPKLEALARTAGGGDRVIFLGNIGAAGVRALLAASDIFVLNSTYEGLPHVVLEAMAAGTPVIATDVGGTGEVVVDGETGIQVPAGNDAALAAAIRRLLADDGEATRLATAAAALIRRAHDEATCFAEYEAILEETARAPARRRGAAAASAA